MSATNPLTAFRKPDHLARRTGESHFSTQRDDVINDTEGLTSIYPGEFTYIPDPTMEVQLVTWEDDDSQKALSLYLKMTGRDGYQPCLASEWKVSERLQTTWKSDGARLTLSGKSKNTLVLMWRTGADYDKARERRLAVSNDVQKSAEEKQAELQNQLDSIGASVKVTLRDDDDVSDDRAELPSKPGRKRR